MINEQEANIAAAKLLGRKCVADLIHQTPDGKWHTVLDTDLFTSPADCLAVIKKLGEHGVSIRVMANRKDWVAGYFERGGWLESQPTYEEAVGAACLDIKL